MSLILKVAVTASSIGSVAANSVCLLTSYFESQSSQTKTTHNACIEPVTCDSPYGCLDFTGTSAGLGLIACNGMHYPFHGTSTTYAVTCDCASLDAPNATNCAGATPAVSYDSLPYCAKSYSHGGCGINYCNPVRTEMFCSAYISPNDQYAPSGFRCPSALGCVRNDNNNLGNDLLV